MVQVWMKIPTKHDKNLVEFFEHKSIINPINVKVAVNTWNNVTSSSSDNLHF